MLLVYLKKYRVILMNSIFFFYLGCGITLSLLRMDCADLVLKTVAKSDDFHTLHSSTNIEYAVLILSSPSNKVRRDAIRATWMKFTANIYVVNGERLYDWNHSDTHHLNQYFEEEKQDIIKLYFVIGTQGLDESNIAQLHLENRRSNDLLLLHSLEDNYKNLSEKMLHAMAWFVDNLKNLKYLVKCDDDSFMRIDLIVKDLEAYAPEMNAPEISQYVSNKYQTQSPRFKGVYWGYFNGKARVYLSGKWQEKNWFMCDTYLPYALGGGYVLSRSIVDYVVRNADFLSRYNSEDVSMGVWTAPLDQINRVHDIRFDTEWQSRGCQNHLLIRHKQSPADMSEMYRMLVRSQGEKLCSKDNEIRKSYLYKWDLLPSQCCKV